MVIVFSYHLKEHVFNLPYILFSSGESKSVYVKNLPPTVTTFDIQQEFENFGRIKPDGVFIKNRKVGSTNHLQFVYLACGSSNY